MTRKKYFAPFLLLVIFIVALILRLYRLDLLALYADEANHYARFLFLTNPVSNLPSLIYREIFQRTFSYTWLFGLNQLGVRFGSALYGALIPVSIYFLASSVTKDRKTALLASLLAAVIPSLFMISRIGHTAVPLLVIFTCLQTYFYLKAKSIKEYFISLFFLFLGTIYYPSMVVIAPIIFLLTTISSLKLVEKSKRLYLIILTSILISFGSFVVFNRFPIFRSSYRAMDLAIWNDVNTPWEIDKFRALSWNSTPSIFSFGLPPEQLANKIFLNRATANLSIFTKNYLSFFSQDWLFLRGDAILRHSTGMVGAFYPFLLPFMLFGAFRFFQSADKKKRITFLIWILISPVPAALTKDGAGYLLRVVTMLPFLTYFCALGIVDSFTLIHRRLKPYYFIFLSLLFIYSVWSFFYGYFHVYPALSARAYEYGFKELSDFQVSHQSKTMLVIWDGYYHNGDFRFWQKTPFDQYEAFKLKQIVIGESTFWQTFPNLYFSSPKSVEEVRDFIKQYKPSYVVLPDEYFVRYPSGIKNFLDPIAQVKYPDQTFAFQIFTPNEKK